MGDFGMMALLGLALFAVIGIVVLLIRPANDPIAQDRTRIDELQAQLASLREEKGKLEVRLEASEKRADTEKKLLDDNEQRLRDSFRTLASEALQQNNQGFLDLANERLAAVRSEAASDLESRRTAIETLVKPLGDSLDKINTQIAELERTRGQAYGQLSEQVRSLVSTESELRAETAKLSRALRAPHVRGRWGEVQLKRVVELAGMLNHCDFFEQQTVATDDGRLRPDLRVQLPGGVSVIVDAKTPLLAYLESLDAPSDEARLIKLREHARQVRDHMAKLEAKAYWDQFNPAPQFVVMFLPGETFFSAALEQDPSLIEAGRGRVVLATPTTLIALLRAVSYGWMQHETSEKADQIQALGRELYERLSLVAEYFDGVGLQLGRSVDAFNKAVASFESRLASSARRFKDYGIVSDRDVTITQIEKIPRKLIPLSEPQVANGGPSLFSKI